LLDELKQKHAEHVFSYVDAEGCVLNLGEFISLQSKEIFASTVPEDGEAFTDVLGKSNQEMKYKVTSQFYKRSKH